MSHENGKWKSDGNGDAFWGFVLLIVLILIFKGN